MKTINFNLPTKTHQNGTVLIIALIFLMILSLLGISAIEGSILDAKLAANDQDRKFALRVAEIGLLQASYVGGELNPQTLDPGDVVATVPAVTGIDRMNGLFAETTEGKIIYTGNFSAPRGDGSGQSFQLAIFEIESTGLSTGADQDAGKTYLRTAGSMPYFNAQSGNPILKLH